MTQAGDRELVLARLRAGTAALPPPNEAHPAPPPTPSAPEPRSHLLDDGADLLDVLTRTATSAGCTVHRDTDFAELVEHFEIRTAVTTTEPAVEPAAAALRALGVDVGDAADRAAAAAADLGVTSCRAAVASTGSLVLGSEVPGARWASLLPRVHVCVVPAALVVAQPGDVLRRLTNATLPANLVFVSGPSRTGDIEQLLTRGVHGPVAVDVVLMNSV